MFRFRKVTHFDKKRVLEISSKIWGGHDYLQYVFDDWVTDQEGEFTLWEKGGITAGFSKYTRQSDTEAWLEGMRVEESFAKYGAGKAIIQYYISRAKAEGIEAIRLSAFADNKGSIKIVESLGFKKDGYFTLGYKDADKISKEPFASDAVINIMSTATAWDLMTRGNAYYMSNGYISYGWTFRKASYELVNELVKDKCVFGVLKDCKISSIMILTRDSRKDGGLNIGFIDGDMASMKELVSFAEMQTLKLEMAYCEMMAHMDESLINVLELNNFDFLSDRYKEGNVFVYCMRLME